MRRRTAAMMSSNNMRKHQHTTRPNRSGADVNHVGESVERTRALACGVAIEEERNKHQPGTSKCRKSGSCIPRMVVVFDEMVESVRHWPIGGALASDASRDPGCSELFHRHSSVSNGARVTNVEAGSAPQYNSADEPQGDREAER